MTRLLGQSPAGLSATSDIRNYYDMIAARQEIDLRPQLERLDRLLLVNAKALFFTTNSMSNECIEEFPIALVTAPLWIAL